MDPRLREWAANPNPAPSTAPEPDAFYGVVVALGIFGGGVLLGVGLMVWWILW